MEKCALNLKDCKFDSFAHFNKEELIQHLSEKTGRYGIITSGEARVIRIDESGQQTILEFLSVGESFGEQFYFPLEDGAIFVIANTDCDVHFINIQKAMSGCNTLCEYREGILRRMLMLSFHHSQNQSVHLDILSQRTLRDKILAYLSYQTYDYRKGYKIKIPFSLVDLSHYLCVDRSAMMREIKKMNDEGLIKSSGRTFEILEVKE